MGSLATCRKYEQCFALATHCMESAAQLSTDSDCALLRDRYHASLPGPVPSYSNRDRYYRESSLGRQCYAFACEAYRSYFPSVERCTLSYDTLCDLPGDVHYDLVLAAEGIAELLKSWQNEDALKNAVTSDLDGVLRTTAAGLMSATVISVVPSGNEVTLSFRLENSTEFGSVSAFEAALRAGSSYLTTTNTVFTAMGGSGSVTMVQVSQRTLAPKRSGAGALLEGCDNTCVIGVSIGVIFAIILILCVVMCIRYLCFRQTGDEGPSSMSAAVSRIKTKHQERQAAALKAAEDGARLTDNAGEDEPGNEPTEL